MIDATHRFHNRGSLRFVQSRGQTVRSSKLLLRYVRNTRLDVYRVAVVVSRKVSKSAVRRNRIRRRIFEIVRKVSANIPKSYDMVFIAYEEELAHMSHPELEGLVLGQLRTAGVLSKDVSTDTGRDILGQKETNT